MKRMTDLRIQPVVSRQKSLANNLTVKNLLFFVRSNPNKLNEAILVFGDCQGQVNALLFSAATMALFDRPSQPAGSKQGENNIHSYMIVIILTFLQRTKEKQNQSDTMYIQVLNVLFLISSALVNYLEKHSLKVPASSLFCEIQESSEYLSVNKCGRWNLHVCKIAQFQPASTERRKLALISCSHSLLLTL